MQTVPTKISVVIPCYNQGQYLADAVNSALSQDYPDKEIIVVNDGSLDHTASVATSFGNRILYIEQPNGGAAKARNSGIQAASGEYIAFLDADDICLPGRLQLQVVILDSSPAIGLVATDAYLINAESCQIGLKSSLSGTPRNSANFRWNTVEYCATTSTVMVRRQCFDVVGLFEESSVVHSAGEDWLQWVRIAHDFDMRYIDQVTIGYRIHGMNLTNDSMKINQGNRIASQLAIASSLFPTYPAHFRAKLLFYRFATAWHTESKSTASRYFLSAVKTDPYTLPYGLKVLRQGILNTIRRLRKDS